MHYCSAIIKKIKAIGLGPYYTEEESGLRHFIGKLFALAFLPPQLIPEVYNWIMANKINHTMAAHPCFERLLLIMSRLGYRILPFPSLYGVYISGQISLNALTTTLKEFTGTISTLLAIPRDIVSMLIADFTCLTS
jgi:hypothetical protein